MDRTESIEVGAARKSNLPILKWTVFLVIASFLAWHIVIINLSDHYARQYDIEKAAAALAWYPEHPRGLFKRGLQLTETNSQQAEIMLRKAAEENPTNGYNYMVLALLAEARGDVKKASNLMTAADFLSPMRSTVQLGAAEFWMRRGEMDEAIKHLSVALELRPQIRESLYPNLLRLADNPSTRPTFGVLLKEPPSWWESFFAYAAVNSPRLDTLRTLYQMRSQSAQKPTVDERRLYVKRLQDEKLWLDAYFVWLDGLDANQLAQLGNVYNGNFELPLTNEGFGWRTPKAPGVLIETAPVYGATGSKALHVVFEGGGVHFRHLFQHLFLEPGDYRFLGRVQTDNLQTSQGVQWVLKCVPDSENVLGVSERFLGISQWRRFATQFTVPAENCRVQELRLELVGRFKQEFEASGGVWFDALSINRL